MTSRTWTERSRKERVAIFRRRNCEDREQATKDILFLLTELAAAAVTADDLAEMNDNQMRVIKANAVAVRRATAITRAYAVVRARLGAITDPSDKDTSVCLDCFATQVSLRALVTAIDDAIAATITSEETS